MLTKNFEKRFIMQHVKVLHNFNWFNKNLFFYSSTLKPNRIVLKMKHIKIHFLDLLKLNFNQTLIIYN